MPLRRHDFIVVELIPPTESLTFNSIDLPEADIRDSLCSF